MSKRFSTKNIVLSGMFIALGLVLPFVTGQVPQIGSMLLPMHIPVLICGYVCGGPLGLIVGFITPLLRNAIFGKPSLINAVAMAFELTTYGFMTGFLYRRFEKKNVFIYATLIISMICGRIVWGIAKYALFALGFTGQKFTLAVFFADGFTNAIPGIILQIAIIPVIIMALRRGNLIDND